MKFPSLFRSFSPKGKEFGEGKRQEISPVTSGLKSAFGLRLPLKSYSSFLSLLNSEGDTYNVISNLY